MAAEAKARSETNLVLLTLECCCSQSDILLEGGAQEAGSEMMQEASEAFEVPSLAAYNPSPS